MNKHRRIVLVTAMVCTIIVGSGFWFLSVPTVDFWLDTDYYYKLSGGKWVTAKYHDSNSFAGTFMPVNCKNSGLFGANFEITVAFNGAAFSTETPLPYQQINETAAKFSYILGGLQEKRINVYFVIQNETSFVASLSISSSQESLEIANAQKSSIPWDRSYRELHYWFNDESNQFSPAVIN